MPLPNRRRLLRNGARVRLRSTTRRRKHCGEHRILVSSLTVSRGHRMCALMYLRPAFLCPLEGDPAQLQVLVRFQGERTGGMVSGAIRVSMPMTCAWVTWALLTLVWLIGWTIVDSRPGLRQHRSQRGRTCLLVCRGGSVLMMAVVPYVQCVWLMM